MCQKEVDVSRVNGFSELNEMVFSKSDWLQSETLKSLEFISHPSFHPSLVMLVG